MECTELSTGTVDGFRLRNVICELDAFVRETGARAWLLKNSSARISVHMQPVLPVAVRYNRYL